MRLQAMALCVPTPSSWDATTRPNFCNKHLDEEKQTDLKLNQLAERLNLEAKAA